MIHARSSRETEALEDACSRHGLRVGVLLMWEDGEGKLIPYQDIEIRLIHGSGFGQTCETCVMER